MGKISHFLIGCSEYQYGYNRLFWLQLTLYLPASELRNNEKY